MTEGTYLYAITRHTGESSAEGLTGVVGTPVRTLAESGLVAYVGTVPLGEFGEAALRRNLEDLAWLEATARAHHGVVDAVARVAPVAPVRLVTVYRGDEQVRALLRRRRAEFTAMLEEVTGRREWGVKVYVDPQGAADTAATGSGDQGSPGMAYLKRRRTDLRTREEAWRRAVSRAERIDAALSAISVASRRHRPQDPQLSGREDWMVLNGAYLVDEGRDAEFAAAVGAFRESGVDVQLTGPWAPYSFTTLESDEDAMEGARDR